jgi:hypothetical protein
MEPRRILTANQAEAQAQVLNRLTEVIRTGEAVLLVGSGCSRPMFPTWSDLVQQLAAVAEHCIPGGFNLPEFAVGEEIQALQLIRDAMEGHQEDRRCLDRYKQRLIQLFEISDHQPTRLHELLVSLPFRGCLTTNYEFLIERAIDQVRGPRGEERWVDVQSDEPFFIQKAIRTMVHPGPPEIVIHVHGTSKRPGGIVLTTSDYERAYGISEPDGASEVLREPPEPRPYAREVLRTLMTTRRIVFVGFGLRDPALMRVLQAVTEFGWEWDEPIHYAVMPLEEDQAASQWEQAEHLRSVYGVEVLFYEVNGGDHSDLTATFEELAARLGISLRRMVGLTAEEGPPEPAIPPALERRNVPSHEDAHLAEHLEHLTRTRVERNLSPLVEPGDPIQEGNRAD